MRIISLLMMMSFCLPAQADNNPQQFERCLGNVLEKKPGQTLKVELKLEADKEVYEFNVRGTDGHDWDLECQKATGDIIEIEQEVAHPNHPLFKANVKFNEKEAREIALARFGGEIVEVEYEIEDDGSSSYEFDIDDGSDQQIKLEIDAATGEIVEVNHEIWQVGLE
jgi:uncharacterized membrane protein YkoI